MDNQSDAPSSPSGPSGIARYLGQARGLLESAAGIGVVTGALYLLGVVHEQAFFNRFGIRPLYLDAPPSLYVFRGAPAIVTVLFTAYLVYLFRALGAVASSFSQRGFRGSMRDFFLPRPGEVQHRGEIVPFGAARLALGILLFSPLIVVSFASSVIQQNLDDLSLLLAAIVAISFVRWSTIRGPLLRHVPETSRTSLERLLAVAAVMGIGLVSAQRTGEREAWELVTGQSRSMVQVRLQLWPEVSDALPPGEYFAVLMTEDNYYLMKKECPSPQNPRVFAVPRTVVGSAELRSVDPTPEGTPAGLIPGVFVPRAFCWDPEDLKDLQELEDVETLEDLKDLIVDDGG